MEAYQWEKWGLVVQTNQHGNHYKKCIADIAIEILYFIEWFCLDIW